MNISQLIADSDNIFNMSLMTSALLLLLFYVNPVLAEDPIGEVVFARGAVSAQTSGGQIRILG